MSLLGASFVLGGPGRDRLEAPGRAVRERPGVGTLEFCTQEVKR
jgi:hypothetical protein